MIKKKDSILFATITVSILTIIGKVLGFGREAIIAAFYGATAETDAFFFAQSMHNMLFPAVSSGLAAAFTAMYVKRLAESDTNDSNMFVSRCVNATIVLGVILSIFGIVTAPFFVPIFSPGFTEVQSELAIHLTKMAMGAFVLIMLQYMIAAILNSQKYFIASQCAALTYNLAIIVFTLVVGNGKSMDTLMISVILAMMLQVFVLVLFCKGKIRYDLFASPFHKDISALIKMAIPVLLGDSVWQLNNIVDKVLSSSLEEGSLSGLSYANSLNALVIGIFVTSLSTVLFPTLTMQASSQEKTKYGKTLINSLRTLSFILIPICVVTFISSIDIVKIIYGRGAFDSNAVVVTSAVLACYAPNFVFVGIREVLTRGFFAVQNTKIPAKNSAIGLCCNILFSVFFVQYIGIMGIALGTSVASFVSALLLMIDTNREIHNVKLGVFFESFGYQLLSGIVCIIVLSVINKSFRWDSSILSFLMNTLVCLFVYLIVIYLVDKKQVMNYIGLFNRNNKEEI